MGGRSGDSRLAGARCPSPGRGAGRPPRGPGTDPHPPDPQEPGHARDRRADATPAPEPGGTRTRTGADATPARAQRRRHNSRRHGRHAAQTQQRGRGTRHQRHTRGTDATPRQSAVIDFTPESNISCFGTCALLTYLFSLQESSPSGDPVMTIRKVKGGYKAVSRKGRALGRVRKTRAGAQKDLARAEMFKAIGKRKRRR